MITQYHRPKTIEEALELMRRSDIILKPLGGGVSLSHDRGLSFEVLDLQELGLEYLIVDDHMIRLGACVTLSDLRQSKEIQVRYPIFTSVINHETSINVQNTATIGGLLTTANGRSPLCTALIALQSDLVLLPGSEVISIDSWMHSRNNTENRKFIQEIRFKNSCELKFDMIARSPMDRPILCVAAAFDAGGISIAIGGYGEYPVRLETGSLLGAAVSEAQDICSKWDDEWASGEYRSHVVEILITRLFSESAR